MKKAIVTGGTGYLGSHLIPKLEESGIKCYLINSEKFNLTNYTQAVNFFVEFPFTFDYIFHLAADTKAGDYCMTHQGDQWISNQLINTNIIRLWKNFTSDAKFIAMGTSCMYDFNLGNTYEENILKGMPHSSLLSYAMTKRMLLIGLKAMQDQFDMKWNMFIPSTLYGPGFKENDNHFIYDLIRKIYNFKLTGEKAVLWGNGNQMRELIYIDDAVKLIIDNKNEENQIFNLGSECVMSIKGFAQLLCDILNISFDEAIRFDTTKYVGDKIKYLTKNSRFEKFKFTDLKFGLFETIKWFDKSLENE